MEKLYKVKEELKSLISKNRLASAMEFLGRILLEEAEEKSDILVHSLRRFRENNTEKAKGTISNENFWLEKNRIADTILQVVKELEPSDISELGVILEEIHNPILVICNDEKGKDKMEQIFNSFYFVNLKYYYDKRPLSKEELNDYDLVILNAMYSSNFDFYNKLEGYLQYDGVYFLYFGKKDFRFEEEEYAEKLHFANSVFSLFARIREVLDYRKYFNPIEK
ncbi:MAG: hypothetical protein DHS20C18_40770 [Saprospiraceae bacterium]|nr:MAG: hypothetical protein DHS20C18_40770 [Saprospiraceae bacterium]